MATYLYTRFSPKNRAYQEHLAALQAHTGDAKHFEDQVQGCVPPNEREQFQSLFNNLQSGDTLVIWWFTVFGRDFSQALATIEDILDKGVTLQTLCQPMTFAPNSAETQTLLSMLSGYAQVQTQHRLFAAEQGRRALKRHPEQWKQKFRGRPADRSKHKQIAALLFEGLTLAQVAEQCDVSLSTVKRVKAKLSEHDHEGGLRRRGHGKHAHFTRKGDR